MTHVCMVHLLALLKLHNTCATANESIYADYVCLKAWLLMQAPAAIQLIGTEGESSEFILGEHRSGLCKTQGILLWYFPQASSHVDASEQNVDVAYKLSWWRETLCIPRRKLWPQEMRVRNTDLTEAASAAMSWKLGTLWEPCAASLCSRYSVSPIMQKLAATWHSSTGVWSLIEACKYSECGASLPPCLGRTFVSFA